MKFIPGDTFQMGSDSGKTDEQPIHTVTVSNFHMDSTEVTQLAFTTLMEKYYHPFELFGLREVRGIGDNYPMYNICWFDAILFCNARSKEEGYDTVYTYDSISDTIGKNGLAHGVTIDYSKLGYRLATEAEWEYANRAGSTTEYTWGTDSAGKYAWYLDNSDMKFHEVATKTCNSFGIYDMCGNVFEFCNDWYGPYDSSHQIDPHGPDTGELRISRGGSYTYDEETMRSARRMEFMPRIHFTYYGFRCVFPDTSTIGVTKFKSTRLSTRSTSQPRLFHSSQVALQSFSDRAKSLVVYTVNGRKILSVNNNPQAFRAAMQKTGEGIFILYEVW